MKSATNLPMWLGAGFRLPARFAALAFLLVFACQLAQPSPARAEFACPAPPPVQYDIVAQSRYDQSQKPAQVVDDAAIQRNAETLANLRRYSSLTGRLSDQVVKGNREAADCLNGLFDSWARSDALLGAASSRQGEYERFWALAGISLSALKLERSGFPLSAEASGWLRKVAAQVQAEQERSQAKNNLSVWAALSTGTVAAVTNQEDLWQWSQDRIHRFLSTINADGTAPSELARRERATGYHYFAAQPAMIFERVARCYDHPLDASDEQAIGRLRGLLRQIQAGSVSLAEQAGAPQNKLGKQRWFPILDDQTPDADLPDQRIARSGGSVQMLKRATRC